MTPALGYWRVTLHGGFIALREPWLVFFGRRRSCGFYTTRLVRAANRASAGEQAIVLVEAELAAQQLEPFDARPLFVDVENVVELESFGDSPAPGGGFTFYPEGRQVIS